ncbi:MAG: DNA polymerase III subunit delta' [Gammaproteobacteria bacterium]|nr:DNA polymerase III subunit delta' [Gammaproteobacteria bacterium]
MTPAPPFPWQGAQWQRLRQALASGRIAHAWLFTGPAGVGKGLFAESFARLLLCAAPDAAARPCGDCRGCRLLASGTHPDVERIVPEEPGKPIRVDQIRDYCERSTLTTQLGGYKVAIFQPADAMNAAAANSLLKTLEEPVPLTVLVLVTALPHQLPPTIRSRCQRVDFPLPDAAVAAPWLASRVDAPDPAALLRIAGGAPLAAVDLAEPEVLAQRSRCLDDLLGVALGRLDPVTAAQRWLAVDPQRLTDWLVGWVAELVRCRVAGAPPASGPDRQIGPLLGHLEQVDSKFLFGLADQLFHMRRTVGSNLNRQLALEELLTRLSAAATPRSQART